MEEFKKALADEAPYKLSEKMMDYFCSCMEEISLKRYDVIVKAGDVNGDIYFVNEGVVRRTYVDGEKVVTTAFALKGTMIISWHSYCFGLPAYHQFEACCPATVMKITKEKFDELINSSHEFSLWALNMLQCALYYHEFRTRLMKGSPKDRYESLIKGRPEIIQKVPLGIIASYLGVTQSHLSRMRNQIAKGG